VTLRERNGRAGRTDSRSTSFAITGAENGVHYRPRSGMASTQLDNLSDRRLGIFLCLAFGITWGFGLLALLAGAFRPAAPGARLHPLHYIAAFGPSLAGVIMTAATEGWAGIRRLVRRLVPRWAALPWYIAVVVGFPAACVGATWLLAPTSLSSLPTWGRFIYLAPLTLVSDTGPLGEEFGWRGFALPRLLSRRSPMAAALILGAIWFAWHLPTFFIPTLSQSQLSIPLFFVNSLALSVLMTWLYIRTNGDLLLMIVVHVMANYCGAIGIPFVAEVAAEVVLAALMVWGARRPEPNPR